MNPRPASLTGAFVARRLCAFISTVSVIACLCVATQSDAQDAPRFVEFDPSADHAALLADGRPVVSSYEVEFVLDGAAAPFQVADIGKPGPGADGKVLHDLTTTPVSWPIAGATYEVYVSAVGPNGTGRSDPSAPFVVGAGAPNSAPNITLSAPAHAATFTAPATVAISATATDSDGTVARVDFYRDEILVASDTTSPYSASATGLAAGTYTITATAVDNGGASVTSTAAVITVAAANVPPAVALTTPVTGASFTAPATVALTATATDSDGTVARVDFYRNGVLVASDTTSPYSASATGLAAGTYTITATAVDNGGASVTSTAAVITVAAANVPPTVALTTPVTGASFTAPATVALTATATDSDGTVARVDFYRNGVLVASDTTSPYSASATGLAAGTYTITATAVDNAGATTSSAPVTVNVAAAVPVPVVSVAMRDAYVRGGRFASRNYGTAASLLAQQNKKTDLTYESYLTFDASAFVAGRRALLRLTPRLNATSSGVVKVVVASVANTTWSETAVTYNTRPAPGATALADFAVAGTTAALVDVDVTAYVQSEVAAGRKVVCFALKAAAVSGVTVTLPSREAAAGRPMLVVQ